MILIIIQLLLLAVGFLLSTLLLHESNVINSFEIILILLIGWMVSLWLTHKHKPKYYQRKVMYILAPFPKAYIVYLLIALLSAYFITNSIDHLRILFVIITLYTLVEYVFMFFLILLKTSKKTLNIAQPNIAKYIQTDLDFTKEEQLKRISPSLIQTNLSSELSVIVENLYNKTDAKQLPIGGQDEFFFGTIDKLNQVTSANFSLIVLTTRVNDLKNINTVFRKCYDHLIPGGYFIVCYNNIADSKILLKKKFPFGLYYIAYPVHWLFYRVMSKIPKICDAQEWLSQGKNKVLSWVEVSGRLAYSGFDVEFDERYNGMQYIIARKTKTISDNPNPSYYILIKLNRVSLFGHIIKINKVRSMYPYSEFLQKKIFEQNSLGNTGKFKDDPRITPQGKIFRKYWIDELPQLLDWFRGEIKLVGIRAMSQHFFSLYSQKYKDLYLKVKPGIISPIFDEETDTFKDIERIEYAYLTSYEKHPLKTDWKYFWITFKNILKGVRSK